MINMNEYDTEKGGEDDGATKTNIKIARAAKIIIDNTVIKSIRESKKEMWLYNPETGYYLPTAESHIESYCAGDLSVNDKINHIVKNVKGATAINRSKFNEPSDKINLLNGVLDLKTRELLSHSPEYNFKGRLNVKYDEKADCPTFKKLIEQALPDEDDRKCLQEIFGNILENSMREEKAFFLVGKEGSSKSTIVRCALVPLLGSENLCNFTLIAFNDDPYAAASLYGKKANLCMDMGYDYVKDVGMFKELTGQDMITGRQPFEKHFSFFNAAKLLFVCNKLPPLYQNVKDDGGFWRRVIILQFLIQHEETDKDLDAKILAELSGIMNWALEGLYRLWDQGGFTYHKDPFEIWMKNNAESNPISEFFNEYFEVGNSNIVVIDDAWSVYLKWCDDTAKNEKDKLKQKQFGWSMHALGGLKSSRYVKQADGTSKSSAVYSGICWKDAANSRPESTKRAFQDEFKLTQYIKAVILGEWNFIKRPAKEDSGYLNLIRALNQKIDCDMDIMIRCVDAAFNDIYQ